MGGNRWRLRVDIRPVNTVPTVELREQGIVCWTWTGHLGFLCGTFNSRYTYTYIFLDLPNFDHTLTLNAAFGKILYSSSLQGKLQVRLLHILLLHHSSGIVLGGRITQSKPLTHGLGYPH